MHSIIKNLLNLHEQNTKATDKINNILSIIDNKSLFNIEKLEKIREICEDNKEKL